MSSTLVIRVLLIEDNHCDVRLFRALLMVAESQREDFSILKRIDIQIAARLDAGIRSALDSHHDIVLLDLTLPDSKGLETIKTFRKAVPDIPIIVMTGQEDPTMGIQEINEGCQDYLVKGHCDGETISKTILLAIRRKQLESLLVVRTNEMEEAKHVADRATEIKSRFLATASHDLHQPLQSANLYLEVLSGRQTGPAHHKLIEKIENSLDALGDMLNELLDISKLDAGAITPNIKSFPIGELLIRLHEEIAPVAEGKGLVYKTLPTNAIVRSDPFLLESILRNLLGNAIKYTDKGKILFGVKHFGTQVKIEVWDTGRGIPVAQLAKIFDDFHQVDNSNRDRRNWAGLGLSIVKRTADLLGHEIGVSSFVAGGSIFSIKVPLATAEINEVDEDEFNPEVRPSGILVLAFDDDSDILEGLTALLEMWGHRVILRICRDEMCDECGKLGATLAKKNMIPDLIISDNGLRNGCTGISVVQVRRKRWRGAIPSIILTGDTGASLIADAKENGIPLVYKPIKPDGLESAMARALAN